MTLDSYQAWLDNAPEETLGEDEERSLEEAKRVNEGDAGVDAGVFFQELKRYNGSLSLRVPRDLHRALAENAKAQGVSLNQYALYLLTRGSVARQRSFSGEP
ncbi:MAG: type II toxin-antitoxin system HicB family antitoxin [Oscillospiraceae bacterium]|nr:type II toxin-antitoxin system HicB family antitoxin [Oscillospiraceae bacterium]